MKNEKPPACDNLQKHVNNTIQTFAPVMSSNTHSEGGQSYDSLVIDEWI